MHQAGVIRQPLSAIGLAHGSDDRLQNVHSFSSKSLS